MSFGEVCEGRAVERILVVSKGSKEKPGRAVRGGDDAKAAE